MSMLKFDHETRPNLQLESSDFRTHYENVARRTLLSIVRHWRFIASFVALSLALACIIIPVMPRKYSAVALIYPSLYSNEQGKGIARASVDASSLVTGEARLVESDTILQAVVRRLRLDPELAGAKPSWPSQALDWLRGMLFPETRNHSSFDRMVAALRNKVEVTKDTRSYIISVSFTARSADEAAAVVNAIAVEYLRDKAAQRRQDAVTAAESELARQLAINGEKHPKVLQAADAVDVARVALMSVMSPTDGGQDAIMTDESAKLAIPNRTPTAPKGSVILGLSFTLSLLAGIGLALWCDRRGLEPRRFLHGVLSRALHIGQCFFGSALGRVSRARVLLERRKLGRHQKLAMPDTSHQRDCLGGGEAKAMSAGRRRGRRAKYRNIFGPPPPPA